MPELPEVETIKTALEKSIGKTNIIHVYINNKNLREEIPSDFIQKISGANISSYGRRGKYILIHLENGLSIIWHLGMSGRVKITQQRIETDKHDHVIFETGNGIIIYNDARRFGLLTYDNTQNLNSNRLFSKMGFEPFDKNLNGKRLFEMLRHKKISIKEALLDQNIIAGIGNIYASESLFEARILPTREASSLSLKECNVLIEKIVYVLEKAIKAGGSSLKDYKKPDGSLGYFQNMHCVYNKKGQKCPICTCDTNLTGGIKKIVQSGRSTFYCPVKQK